MEDSYMTHLTKNQKRNNNNNNNKGCKLNSLPSPRSRPSVPRRPLPPPEEERLRRSTVNTANNNSIACHHQNENPQSKGLSFLFILKQLTNTIEQWRKSKAEEGRP